MLNRSKISGLIRVLLAVVICVSVSVAVVACGGKTGQEYREENYTEEKTYDDNTDVAAESSVWSLPSRSYFENLDRGSSLEEIVEEIGECGYEGSGIIYHVWSLDDGSKAKLVFNSDGQIEFIYIVTDGSSERIYDREDF